jgi:hypothetical protein
VASDIRIERVTRDGEGVDRIIKEAKANPKSFIKVGILSGTGEHPNASQGETIAEVGWWNEFGTRTIHERPFLRTGLREKLPRYRDILRKGLKQITVGQLQPNQVLGILGVAAVADVQAKIVAVNSPANAPATVDRKGSSSPLIDIGALRQHISWEILEG